jgi:hypothetical protein
MVAGEDPNSKRPVPKTGGASQRSAEAAIKDAAQDLIDGLES